jgi:hypothetical protein
MSDKSTALEQHGSALDRLDAMGGGLADFDGSEGGTPRIKINGAEAKWVDTLTGLEVPEFTGIVCGVVKGRVLWPPEVGEEVADPLCKSLDFKTARPNPKTFPIKESLIPGLVLVEDGPPVMVNCSACNLKEWDTHPTRQGPWCTEQLTMIVMADLDDSGNYLPSLVTFQRSSIKPARQYVGALKRGYKNPFEVYTDFTLTPQKRGNVKYAVPVFKRTTPTDPSLWEACAQTYLAIAEFVTTWRDDLSGDDDSDPKVHVSADLPEF